MDDNLKTTINQQTKNEGNSTSLRNGLLIIGILFIISFFFPIVEDGNEWLFLNLAIFSKEEFRNIPKLPLIAPLLYGILLVYFQRAFDTQKLVKAINIMAVLGIILISSSLDSFGGKIQNLFDSTSSNIFTGRLFILSLVLVYIGSTNLSGTLKGKIAMCFASIGGVLFLFYLLKTQYFPIAQWTRSIGINSNADMNLSMYEIPIKLINFNLLFSGALYITIYLLIIIAAYRSSLILFRKSETNFKKLMVSNQIYFSLFYLCLCLGPVAFIMDFLINGGRIKGEWVAFVLTVFLKVALLFLPFLILILVALSSFYKYFIPEQLSKLEVFINSLLKKAD